MVGQFSYLFKKICISLDTKIVYRHTSVQWGTVEGGL